MKVRVLSACVIVTIALGTAAPLSARPANGEHARRANGEHARRANGEADQDARADAEAQVEFGIKVAQKKLWREATYRFEKAVETDPTYAAAWNNLAIAYEEQGKFPEAEKAYKKAIELDPGNVLIVQNYDLFKEFYDRIARRNRR